MNSRPASLFPTHASLAASATTGANTSARLRVAAPGFRGPTMLGMDARGFLDRLAADTDVSGSLVHVELLPARGAKLEPFGDVPDVVRDRLALLGIEGLYPHQRRALDLLSEGGNVIVATGTASGKTLVYNLAFAVRAVADPKATALYLFPTKALARDQLRQVRALKLPQIRAAVYDGDTPSAERPLIRRNANLVLSNPDMLHASVLPDHARWADFFLRLAYVVVDEAHVARGVFGSHVAMVLRRLRRLVARYGGDPRFVLASATIGNPAELAERLVGLPFEEVTDDVSPRGEKLFALWNPPIVDEESGARRGAVSESAWLLGRLAEWGVRTIAFARSRRAAELLAEFARREVPGGLRPKIKAYRAGYLPEERRRLERALAEGELVAVAATTALELGIDVGSLDAAILAGYPGTRASMWQQAGRAGRREEGSLAVLVAQDDPLDQYLVAHPADLFERPPEAAVIDPTNPYVLEPHLACAAREQPAPPSAWRNGASWSAAEACCTIGASSRPTAASTSARPAAGRSPSSWRTPARSSGPPTRAAHTSPSTPGPSTCTRESSSRCRCWTWRAAWPW